MSSHAAQATSEAGDFSSLKSRFEFISEAANREAEQSQSALRLQYTEFLTKLEQRFQASGELDRLLKVRQEKESVSQSGSTTAVEDPEVSRARETFRSRLESIQKERESKLNQLQLAYANRLQQLEVQLTKDGKIDAAIEIKKERETLLRAGVPQAIAPSSAATRPSLPQVEAPVVSSSFLEAKVIEQSFTLPAGKYRLREKVELKRPENIKAAVQVRLSPGVEFTAAEGGEFFVGAGTVVGQEIQATQLKWSGDLNSQFYFVQSTFADCTFLKGGAWGGPKHAARWHFEDCVIEGSWMNEITVKKTGLRMFGGRVKGVKLPSPDFEGESVSSLALSEWFQVRETLFEKCEVPVSFLLLTSDCKFVDCTFVDDTKMPVVDSPMKVSFQETNCTWKTKAEIPNLQWIKLPPTR